MREKSEFILMRGCQLNGEAKTGFKLKEKSVVMIIFCMSAPNLTLANITIGHPGNMWDKIVLGLAKGNQSEFLSDIIITVTVLCSTLRNKFASRMKGYHS